jgi:uncharacterized protein YkwD
MALAPDSRNRVGVHVARALRFVLALAVVAVAAFSSDSALATRRSERNLTALNHQVLAAVNAFRVAHGRVALREVRSLDRSARRHSLEMGRVGYFAHSSADGTSFWRRIQHYYPEKGHSFWAVGENLVWRSPSLTAAEAMKLWIASPPHLKNLLSRQWRQIGVSAVSVAHAPGVYGGAHAIIVTTDFGVRR